MNIYLVEFGQNDVDLELIIEFLNNISNIFHVTWEGRIPYVGEPIEEGLLIDDVGTRYIPENTYDDEHIFNLFPLFKKPGMTVGIISSPLLSNFFIRTDGDRAVLLSLWQVDDLCDKADKTIEDYIVQNIIIYLLWCEYKKQKQSAGLFDLFHLDTNGCIFDFCQLKPEKVYKLQVGKIEPKCRTKLLYAGVSEELLDVAEDVFTSIRRGGIRVTNTYNISSNPRDIHPKQQKVDDLNEDELRILTYDYYQSIYKKLTAETSRYEIAHQLLGYSE